jgi:hypothetical protein
MAPGAAEDFLWGRDELWRGNFGMQFESSLGSASPSQVEPIPNTAKPAIARFSFVMVK